MAATHILLIGRIVGGQPTEWEISPLPAEEQVGVIEQPVDGELQATIDYAAELQELLDAREDEEFFRRGEW